MGSAHKLKPEIEAFILEQKRDSPQLSCRKISVLVKEKFQIELSKSLINALMKQEGLSAPVGRRRKSASPEKELPPESREQPSPVEISVEESPEPAPIENIIPEEPAPIFKAPLEEAPVEEEPAQPPEPVAEKETIEEKLFGSSEAPAEAPEEHNETVEPQPLLLDQTEHIEPALIEGKEPLEITSQGGTSKAPVEEIPVEKTPEPDLEQEPVIEAPKQEPVEDMPIVTTPPLEIAFKAESEAPAQAAPPGEATPVGASARAEQPIPEPPKEPPKESLTSPHIEDSPEMPDLGEGVGLGAVLLKAVDSIVGGTYYLTSLVKELLHTDAPELVSRTEGLIYAPLFKLPIGPDSTLWTLVNGKHDFQLVMSYLDDLHNNKALDIEANRAIPKLFQEVLYLDIFMEGGGVFHLDSELRSIWSVPNIPYDYALPINKAKALINRYFIRNKPLVLFSAPGYDVPTKEFCDFVLQWDAEDKKIEKITLVSNKADNIETVIPPPVGHRYIVFGLWPWQFTKYRRVINVGEFKPFYFEPLDQHFYITESEVTVVQPYTNQTLVFRACLLKRDPASKTTLLIGTNIDDDKVSAGEIAELYLRNWPNLDEGFEDFSHKIELFTYTATSRRLFSIEAAIQETGKELEIRDILNYYLRAMDSYLRWHILPTGYEDYDFPTANARFYSLRAVFYKKKQYYLVQFYLPKGYNYESDLAYMCRRLNEKDVTLRGGKVWFSYIKELV
jgi:hypothetical protein